ncbi:hypothetical protein ABBQ38_002653 [Trebouxia sp. C0009 RCD-2024]
MMRLALCRLTCVVACCVMATMAAQQRRHLRASVGNEEVVTQFNNNTSGGEAVVLSVKSSAVSESPEAKARSQYLGICVTAKDQHDDIHEWIEHHERLGAGKIYVFDDSSNPPMLEQLKHFIQSGLVEYHFIGHNNHSVIARPQLYVYDQCIARYRSKHQFIAFIDVDEFLILRDDTVANLPALLHEYEDEGGLVVNWVQFGSSGHVHRPHGGTLANFWKCVPLHHAENLHVKTIANTLYVDQVSSDPHHFQYLEGKTAVNEKFEPVEGPRSNQNEISRIALYHYVTKSRDEYKKKIERGSAMKNFKTMEFFEKVEEEAIHECRDALDWVKSRQE